MNNCISCQKNIALNIGPDLFHCQACLDRQAGFRKPGDQPEFTTENIKSARVEYEDDIIQPFREGKVSKKYLQKHGTKGIQVSKKEVKEAMSKPDVWNGMEGRYYKE